MVNSGLCSLLTIKKEVQKKILFEKIVLRFNLVHYVIVTYYYVIVIWWLGLMIDRRRTLSARNDSRSPVKVLFQRVVRKIHVEISVLRNCYYVIEGGLERVSVKKNNFYSGIVSSLVNGLSTSASSRSVTSSAVSDWLVLWPDFLHISIVIIIDMTIIIKNKIPNVEYIFWATSLAVRDM